MVIKFKEEFYIILAGLFLVFVKIFLGKSDQINQVIFFLIVPMMLSVILATENKLNKRIIGYLILFFFMMECFLAIYERLFLINVFPYTDNIEEGFVENWAFRSSGFLGHPLANALCVSIIMGFVLTTSMKLINKFFFLIIGFISLLCFNARGAILIWSFLAVIYILHVVKDKRTKKIVSLSLLFFLMTSAYLIYFVIVNYGLGGRLFNEKINDGSAQTRIEVFEAFSYINPIDFWYGNGTNYIPIMNKLGAGGVENPYIVLIINYGIVMTIILFILYYFLIKRFFKSYTLFYKFMIVSSFLLVGSTNNGLADSMPWGFFMLCIHSFPLIGKAKIKNKFHIKNRVVARDVNQLDWQVGHAHFTRIKR